MVHIYYYAARRKMERDIKAERTFTSLADKLYFLCELSWEMLSTHRMSLNYKLFPERIRRYFGPKVAEVEEDHWHYDLLGQTMLVRDTEGNYLPAHRSLLEFFVAYKFAAEMGALLPEFTEAAHQQSDIAVDASVQDYTWSAYFQRERDEHDKIQPIPPLRSFTREPVEHLVTTVGAQQLTSAVLTLMGGMIDAERLWEVIEATRGRSPGEVGYTGGNAATLLRVKGESFKGVKLARTVLTGAHLPSTNLTGADLKGAMLGEADLSHCTLRNASLREADLQRANFSRANLTGADLSNALCQSTSFRSAILRQAIFMNAKCSSYFQRASVQGANFKGAQLGGSDWGFGERVLSHEAAKKIARHRGAIV
jgi:uncharacterized protein YjbI with pentapeptide repeats